MLTPSVTQSMLTPSVSQSILTSPLPQGGLTPVRQSTLVPPSKLGTSIFHSMMMTTTSPLTKTSLDVTLTSAGPYFRVPEKMVSISYRYSPSEIEQNIEKLETKFEDLTIAAIKELNKRRIAVKYAVLKLTALPA
ncbi:hypothetical protein GBAR_LOCUS30852, partial [Geodia barretti]